MGAKTALLFYTSGDPADLLRMLLSPEPGKTSALVAATHPGWTKASGAAGGSPDAGAHPAPLSRLRYLGVTGSPDRLNATLWPGRTAHRSASGRVSGERPLTDICQGWLVVWMMHWDARPLACRRRSGTGPGLRTMGLPPGSCPAAVMRSAIVA